MSHNMKYLLIISLFIFLTGCNNTASKTNSSINDVNQASKPVNSTIDKPNDGSIPEHIMAHFKQGNYFLSKSDYTNAIRKFQLATKLKPDFTQAYYNLGVCYFDTNRPEEAIKEWHTVIKLDKDYYKAYLSLGYAYESLGNNIQAVEFYDKYIQLKPDDPNAKKIDAKINTLRGEVTGTGIIGKVVMADNVNPETFQSEHSNDIFDSQTPLIFTTAEVGDAPKNTSIKAAWYYLGLKDEELEVNSEEKIITGPNNLVFTIQKPANAPWPAGRYEIRIYVNGKENLSVPFTILKEDSNKDAQR